jgi:hypothetical protein
MTRKFALIAILAIVAHPSLAGEWDLTGLVGFDSRAFWVDGQYPGQDNGVNLSLMVQPELYWRSGDGTQRLSVVGFARKDWNDAERTHADFREAIWGYQSDNWDLNIGIGKVFWGVAESAARIWSLRVLRFTVVSRANICGIRWEVQVALARRRRSSHL